MNSIRHYNYGAFYRSFKKYRTGSTFISRRSVLFGLVSAIGYRLHGEKMRAVAVNWDADETSEPDRQILSMIKKALEVGENLDEIAAYCQIFPETVHYNSQQLASNRIMNVCKTVVEIEDGV